jgi:hypothetical protein
MAHERSSLYSQMLDSVRGSAFFGVPHRGADLAFWLNFAANLVKVPSFGGTNTTFVAVLQSNSRTFADISQRFIERGACLEIRTFYETMKTCNQLVCARDRHCQ